MRGVLKMPGTAEGGSPFVSPLPSVPPAELLRLAVGFLLSCLERGRWDKRVLQVVHWALSLERARQFVKAFGKRGRHLHVTQREYREMRLVLLYQPKRRRQTIVSVLHSTNKSSE